MSLVLLAIGSASSVYSCAVDGSVPHQRIRAMRDYHPAARGAQDFESQLLAVCIRDVQRIFLIW
jgi:hypothetical protein